ncbi:hypothetical protein ACIF70_08625 [Actinacidiphila glaucinigra]|uniref:hypothetical protein n=1 Tax=Actinacidiphila glaucinigra TaxID=235986 RepID=UPI0037C9DC40
MRKNLKRVGTIAGVSLGATLLAVTNAYATWSSYLSGVRPGFTSHEWADSSYTQIHFKHCYATDGNNEFGSVTVELIRTTGTNTSFGSKTFTECFSWGDGDETSTGVWEGLPSGDYVFKIAAIGGSSSTYRLLSVDAVTVDTTKAD